MSEPRWVIAVGACASGGVFVHYSVLQELIKSFLLMFMFPGCPPRPEQIVDGVMKLQELVKSESVAEEILEYKELLASYNL